MDTALLVVVLSFVALVLAAVGGGALGLGIMKLFARAPRQALDTKLRDSSC